MFFNNRLRYGVSLLLSVVFIFLAVFSSSAEVFTLLAKESEETQSLQEPASVQSDENIAHVGVEESIDESSASYPQFKEIKSEGRKIIFFWNAFSNAYRYRLFYKNGNSWKTIATTDELSYEWNGGVLATEYVFTLRCVAKDGSFSSDYDKNGYKFNYLLSTPVISEVNPLGDNIHIQWDEVPGASGYRVFYKNGNSWKTIGETSDTYFSFSGGVYSAKYTFTVRCIENGKYISSFDSKGYVYTYILNTPVINQASPSGNDVTFSWKAVRGAARYRFFVKNGTSWKGLGYTSVNSFTVKNVSLNVKNVYTVRVVNSKNAYISDYSKAGYTYTLSYGIPKITSVKVRDGKALISWNKIEGVPKYKVFYKNGTSWKTIAEESNTEYSFAMDINETKTFTVRGCDSSGKYITSFDSKGYTFTFRLDTPKITRVSALNVAGAAVKIEWDAVSGAKKYRLFYKSSAGWTTIANTEGTSYQWIFVDPGKEFTYTIRCINDAGTYISSFDPEGYTFKLETDYLKTPKVKSVTATNSSKAVTISWDKINGASKYRVFYKNGTSWKTIGDTTSLSYTWTKMEYNKNYIYTVRCLAPDNTWQSYFDPTGYSYTLVGFSGETIEIHQGMSYNRSLSGVSSWSSSDNKIAKVNKLGIIEGVSQGFCTVTGGGKTYGIRITEPEPLRVAYTSPNTAEIGDTVSLVAITDMTKSAVRFQVGNTYVNADQKTTDYCEDDTSYKVLVWTGKYKVASDGIFSVTAYSKSASSSWQTCDNGKAEIFVMKDKDAEVCEQRRCSDEGIAFIAVCEGLITQIMDDSLAPGNFTVGYGRVIYQGQSFYNNLSKSQAYAYLVDTVNKGVYTSKTNSVLLNNKSKFKQQHFDALVSLVYNLGTGIYADSDLSTLCRLSNLSKATKAQVVNAFCDYHHASGRCIAGLLYRRIDECEMFMKNDYNRGDYYTNKCAIKYSCYNGGISFP